MATEGTALCVLCTHSNGWHAGPAGSCQAGHQPGPSRKDGPCPCPAFASTETGDPSASMSAAPARGSQVGGSHYEKRKIQPWDIWEEYGLNAFEGAIIKYLLRHRDKNGVEDLKKARHTLDKLIELEEGRSGGE